MKRKAFTITATLLLSAFVLLSMVNQVQAESFTATWAGYKYTGFDSFYGDWVVAYESGSTAVLYVNVENDLPAGKQMNISAVGISLNWGDTFNSTQASKTNPVALKNGKYRIFTITFVVPSTANVSNLFLWDYKIYVEHVNATGADPDTEIETRNDLGLRYFVVYSEDQTKCRQMATTITGISALTWNSTKAEILWNKKENETKVAENYYELGEFANAATHYENALSLIDRAYTAEETKGSSWEDAQIALLQAQVKWFEGWGNFFNGLSNMWTLIGVALVLFALGYILRGLAMLRRASAPP